MRPIQLNYYKALQAAEWLLWAAEFVGVNVDATQSATPHAAVASDNVYLMASGNVVAGAAVASTTIKYLTAEDIDAVAAKGGGQQQSEPLLP